MIPPVLTADGTELMPHAQEMARQYAQAVLDGNQAKQAALRQQASAAVMEPLRRLYDDFDASRGLARYMVGG